MSIHVTDFKWEKGKNDVKYIELLEKTLKNEQRVAALAMTKVRQLAKENQEIRNKAITEFAEAITDRADEESFLVTLPDGLRADVVTLDFLSGLVREIVAQLKGGADGV